MNERQEPAASAADLQQQDRAALEKALEGLIWGDLPEGHRPDRDPARRRHGRWAYESGWSAALRYDRARLESAPRVDDRMDAEAAAAARTQESTQSTLIDLINHVKVLITESRLHDDPEWIRTQLRQGVDQAELALTPQQPDVAEDFDGVNDQTESIGDEPTGEVMQ